jgi:hypothetical protein
MGVQRFVLTDAQMSEVFAAARCIPLEGDFPEGLPAASGILPDALTGALGELDPALRQMLDTFSHPDISLHITRVNGEGRGVSEDCILRISGDRCVALGRFGPRHWQIESLESRVVVMARIEELVRQPAEELSNPPMTQGRTAQEGGFCGRCGTLFGDSPAFCRECGESLRGPG